MTTKEALIARLGIRIGELEASFDSPDGSTGRSAIIQRGCVRIEAIVLERVKRDQQRHQPEATTEVGIDRYLAASLIDIESRRELDGWVRNLLTAQGVDVRRIRHVRLNGTLYIRINYRPAF